MEFELRRHLKRNYIANVMDGGFFGLGLGFASFSTIIPLFLSSLTDSAVIIGLAIAMHTLGWQLPQLFVARITARQTRFKPLVLFLAVHERLPFLGLALTAFLLPQIGKEWALGLAFLMLVWQGVGGGVAANPWQSMISKILPRDYLATFYGVQAAAANLLASGSAVAAGYLLERLPYPNNYATSFLIACGFLVFSYLSVSSTYEPAHTVEPPDNNPPHLLAQTMSILMQDHNFRWLIIGRTLGQFGIMGSSFYFVHLSQNLGTSDLDTGIHTSVFMVSSFLMNILLGWLSDRWSRLGVLSLGGLAMVASGLVASLARTAAWFFLANILASVALTCIWTVMMAATIQYSSDEQRPLYIGMATTLIAPATILAPLAGGWLANMAGYPITFAVSSAFGLATFIVWRFYVHPPQNTKSDKTPA
jgi:MFS family permease